MTSAWAQAPAAPAPAPAPAPFKPEPSAPAPAKEAPKAPAPAPAKDAAKQVLQAPPPKPAASAPAVKQAPPAPVAAPRTAVEPKPIPAFVPPGPPPLDETGLHKPVLAVMKAALAVGAEEDAARWVDTGACWVWVGMKRELAWSKYRFVYEGDCKQGRAEGQGRLKVERQSAPGKWEAETEFETTWQGGVPLGEGKGGAGGKLLIGLADRTVLSWLGSSLNEEAEVFAIGRADDQGRVSACSAQAVLSVALSDDVGGDRFKHLLRRSVSVANSQCPERVRALWLASLVPAEGLSLSGSQGALYAQPLRAQAEIREGLVYSYSQRFTSPPALVPMATSVPGAQPLTWILPIEELDHQLLLVFALPVFLLVLLLVAMRIAYASTRQAVVQPSLKKPSSGASSAKRR